MSIENFKIYDTNKISTIIKIKKGKKLGNKYNRVII
jgi:hypothetical protein